MSFEVAAAIAATLAVFAAVATMTGVLSPEGRRWRERAARLDRAPAPIAAGSGGISVLREDSLSGSKRASAILTRFRWAPRMASLLERADLPLKVSEYVLILIVTFLALGAVTWLLSGLWPVGLGFGVAGVIGVRVWVGARAQRRLNAFNKQLPIALHILATSLRSGFSIMESVRTVAREMDEPLSKEFRRILEETRLGGSFEDSLNRMVDRIQSADLKIVARALEIHRRVGGDLAAILDSVAQTMREREELRGHVIALTAQQRFGGMIVGLLPLWVVGFLSVTAPEFISPLWQEPLGRVFMVAGAVMVVLGFVIMRQILKIEV